MIALAVSVDFVSGEDWPMYRHDNAHTGYTASKVPVAPNLLWEFDGGGVANSPAVVDGKVYFGSWSNKFYSLNAENGGMIWRKEVVDGVHTSSPLVADNKVYFGTEGYNNTEFYSLDLENGDIIWTKRFNMSANSSPAFYNGKVYFGSEDDNIYSVDAKTGITMWARNIGHVYTASPTIVDNTVYIGSWGENIYALGAENGNIIWSYQTGGEIDSTPAVVNGVLYIGSGREPEENWAVHALNAENGDVVWISTLNYPVRSSPAVYGNKLFIGGGSEAYLSGERGMIYALSLENGAILWSYPSHGEYIGNTAPVITENKVIFHASLELVILDAENGDVFWTRGGFGIVGPAVVSQAVVADDKIYAGTVSSSGGSMGFYAFGTPAPTFDRLDNVKASGMTKLSGTALGDAVQAVELNWGSGWMNATSLESESEKTYDPSGEYGMDTTRYVNNWSHDWNSRSAPNGTNTIRARILYTNGAYSDETTISLQVENFPLDEVQIAALTAGVVALVVIVFWLRRR